MNENNIVRYFRGKTIEDIKHDIEKHEQDNSIECVITNVAQTEIALHYSYEGRYYIDIYTDIID